MSPRSLLWAAAILAMAAAVACGRTEPIEEIPAAKKAESQADALEEARTVDLPLLDKADKVVIVESKPNGKGQTITLDRADAVKELRDALKTAKVPPSGGENAATITFYKGDAALRTIWIYAGGEWGFDRPGTSWTIGRHADLWKVVKRHLG